MTLAASYQDNIILQYSIVITNLYTDMTYKLLLE